MFPEYYPLVIARSVIKRTGVDFLLPDKTVALTITPGFARQLITLVNGVRSEREIIAELYAEWEAAQVNELLEYLKQQGVVGNSHNIALHVWRQYITNPSLFSHALTSEQVAHKVIESHERNIPSIDFFMHANIRESPLTSMLEQRKSVRAFSNRPVSMPSLMRMLWAGYGKLTSKIVGKDYVVDRHTVPSAGALFPLKLSLILLADSNALPAGVYHVEFGADRTVGLAGVRSHQGDTRKCLVNPLDAHGAQGFVVISGSFDHDAYKYSNRSLPYVLLEAGHAAQNVHLSALEEGLATLEMGGFFDNSLKRFLEHPLEYEPLVMIVFGHESHAADEAPACPGLEVRWAELYADTYRLPFHMAFAGVASSEGAIDWSCGRAHDPGTALLKASAEVEEREANATIANLVPGTWHEVREYAVDPRSLVMYHEGQYRRKSFPFARFDEASVYQWTWGYDVSSGERRLLLSDAVYYPYTPTYARYTAANSSGSAAYSNLQGAIERGALELIEREAFLVTWVNSIAVPRLRITTLPQPIALRLSAIQHEHFSVAVLCVDYLMPTFIWVARGENFATVSACASFTPEEALERSLMELEASIYCRPGSGTAAYTLAPRSVLKVRDHGLIYEQQRYLSRMDFLFGGCEQSFGECRSRFADWNALAQCLAQERQKVYAVKLTRNQDQAVARDLEVAKVFIPGLVPMSFGYGIEPCGMARMYHAPVTAGYLSWPKTFRELNCFPHPFT